MGLESLQPNYCCDLNVAFQQEILNDIPSFQSYTTKLPAVHLSTAGKGMRNLSKQGSNFPFK